LPRAVDRIVERSAMRLWSVIIVVAVGTLLAGFLRILIEAPPASTLDPSQAVLAARCLGPRGEIPVNSAITLLTLPLSGRGSEGIEPPSVIDLQFIATGPVQFEILDSRAREGAETGAVKRLPAGTTLLLAKGNGSFEFRLDRGTAEVRRMKGRFLLDTDERIRFGAADDASYAVLFTDQVAFETKEDAAKKRQFLMAAGTRGSLHIGAGQSLVTTQALAVSPWPYKAVATLLPVRSAGQSGLANLAVEARQPGLRFDTAGLVVSACASSDAKSWQSAGLAEIKARDPGAASIQFTLPSGLLSGPTPWWAPITFVVATNDGQYVGYGGVTAVSLLAAFIVATALTALLFAWLSQLRHETRKGELQQRGKLAVGDTEWDKAWKPWFLGLFIGKDGQPSLSLFQVFIWTVITIWGLLYVFVVTGNLLSLTQEMMWLLAIAGTGSVLARWISTSKPDGDAQPQPQTLEFWQILSTEGRFDLLKLQLFVFTLTIAVYVVWRIADTGAFPALDTNTLLLLGVSQGLYIGGKVAGTTALSRAQALKLELDLKNEEKQKLESEKDALEKDKKSTAGGTLAADKEKRLKELPGLIKAKDDEITTAKEALKKIVKEIGLPTTV
jgi:hypothetical protein